MTRYSSTMTEALQEIREGFSPKQIKMAIGIAADPRYKGGNYSGAYKQIEKIKKGLADHPQVAAVLKRLNTDFDPEMVEDWEDVSENSFDLTELAMPRRDFDKLKKGDKVTITYDSSIKKGHVTTFEVKGRSRSAKYKVDKITMQPEGAPSGRMKYYLYSRDGGDATLAMGDMGASMTKIKMEGLKEAAHELAEKLKVSDGVGAWIKDFQKSDAPQFQGKSEEDRKKMALAAFADAGGKLEETELGEKKTVTKTFGVEFQIDAPEEKPITTGREPHVKLINKLVKKYKLFDVHADDLSKFNVKDNVGGRNVQKFFKELSKSYDVIRKKITDNYTSTDFDFSEEVDLDEGRMKELHGYIEKGMSAQDIAKKMKLDVKTIKSLMDETELDEAKSATGYEIFHKDFSSAMQHATAFAKSKGQPIKKDEIDNKVATGPKKPSKGKENSYTLETEKGKRWSVQVYNMGNKFELNRYLTSSHVPEGDMLDEAPKMKYALVGKDMKIYSMGSDERDLRLDRKSLEQRFKDVAPLKMARLKTAQSIGDKVDKSQLKEEEGPDNRPDSAKEVEQGRDDKKKTRIAQLQLQIAKAQETINKLNAQEKPNG